MMSVTLPIIIGTIVSCWLIALCFKDFRERCKDDLPDLLLDFYKMYKEDDSNGIFYKIFLAIVVFAIYPLVIAIIFVSPIICGIVAIINFIKARFKKNKKDDVPLKDWEIRDAEKKRKEQEMEGSWW